jgi:hypothetical protein
MAIFLPSGWKSLPVASFDKYRTINVDILVSILFIPGNKNPIKVAVIYNHPGNKLDPMIFKDFKCLRHKGKPLKGLIIGDLNSPKEAWGSRTTNASGTHLQQVLEDSDHNILNDPLQPTFSSASTSATNLLDLVMQTA